MKYVIWKFFKEMPSAFFPRKAKNLATMQPTGSNTSSKFLEQLLPK